MVRILAVADETSERLWNARVRELRPDLVVSAGDLPWDYLEFLASALDDIRQDITDVVAFLVEEGALALTGQVLPVNNGFVFA